MDSNFKAALKKSLVIFALVLACVSAIYYVIYEVIVDRYVEDEIAAIDENLNRISKHISEHGDYGCIDAINVLGDPDYYEYRVLDSSGDVVYPVWDGMPSFEDTVVTRKVGIAGSGNVVYAVYYREYYSEFFRTVTHTFSMGILLLVLLAAIGTWFFIHPNLKRKEDLDANLRAARDIQRRAVSRRFLHTDKYDFYAVLEPQTETGGDLYVCFIKDNCLKFAIGDVCGKGIPAALVMTQIVELTRYLLNRDESPEVIAEAVNNELCRADDNNMFATMLIGSIDVDTCEMTFCNAAHTKSIVDGEFLEQKPNFVVGGIRGIKYERQNMTLHRGSTLILYTDGVNEATIQKSLMFGEDRILDFSRKVSPDADAKSITEGLKAEVYSFLGKTQQNDDIAIMTIRL